MEKCYILRAGIGLNNLRDICVYKDKDTAESDALRYRVMLEEIKVTNVIVELVELDFYD